MVGIALQEHGSAAEAMRGFRKQHGLTYVLLSDQSGAVATRFGVEAIPASFVLDGQRHLVTAAEDPDHIVSALRRMKTRGGKSTSH